jgi:hypothetical protein
MFNTLTAQSGIFQKFKIQTLAGIVSNTLCAEIRKVKSTVADALLVRPSSRSCTRRLSPLSPLSTPHLPCPDPCRETWKKGGETTGPLSFPSASLHDANPREHAYGTLKPSADLANMLPKPPRPALNGARRRTPTSGHPAPRPLRAINRTVEHTRSTAPLTRPSQTSSPSPPLHHSSSPATPSPQTTATAASASRRSQPPLELPLVPGGRGGALPPFLLHCPRVFFPYAAPRRRPRPCQPPVSLVARGRRTPRVPVRGYKTGLTGGPPLSGQKLNPFPPGEFTVGPAHSDFARAAQLQLEFVPLTVFFSQRVI